MCVAKKTCRSRLPAFGPQIIVLAQITGEVHANSLREPFYYNLLLLIYQVLRKKAGNAYLCYNCSWHELIESQPCCTTVAHFELSTSNKFLVPDMEQRGNRIRIEHHNTCRYMYIVNA